MLGHKCHDAVADIAVVVVSVDRIAYVLYVAKCIAAIVLAQKKTTINVLMPHDADGGDDDVNVKAK